MVCQRHDFLTQTGVLGIMCFFHCPGFNGTNTRFCRETDNVTSTHFLGLVRTQTLLRQSMFGQKLAVQKGLQALGACETF